uniref:Homing endonuclease LAGLIDADG domain-containing protein n=1 Tax=Ulva flexuosa TaxID=83791 RepID=A0A3S6P7U0_9CHLO|nr:hypothetical protein [Ulva flexuosa]
MTIYNNLAIYKNKDLLGSYLAGLWEGDGHIKINKCRNCRPSFHITFNILDNVLAQRLLDVLTVYKIVGTLTYKRKCLRFEYIFNRWVKRYSKPN